jgi:glutathione synthase/RimK-type ligase-like ATP-grasp enzyme
MKVCFVTGTVYALVDKETSYLMEALKKRNIASAVEAWDLPDVDWGKYDLAINRTTSNYMLKPQEYVDWAYKTQKKTTLWNSAKVIEWNHNKRYLLELEQAGIAIPPTRFISKNSGEPLNHYLLGTHWEETLIKAAVTAGSFGMKRFREVTPEAEAHFRALNRDGYVQVAPDSTRYDCIPGDTILQEFQPEIEYSGESSLIFFGGKYSHAVIKKPKIGDMRAHPMWGASMGRYDAPVDERRLAEDALEVVGEPTEYARVDVMRGRKGPLIIEVELIEPMLFFDFFPETVDVFADHIERFLRR